MGAARSPISKEQGPDQVCTIIFSSFGITGGTSASDVPSVVGLEVGTGFGKTTRKKDTSGSPDPLPHVGAQGGLPVTWGAGEQGRLLSHAAGSWHT